MRVSQRTKSDREKGAYIKAVLRHSALLCGPTNLSDNGKEGLAVDCGRAPKARAIYQVAAIKEEDVLALKIVRSRRDTSAVKEPDKETKPACSTGPAARTQ